MQTEVDHHEDSVHGSDALSSTASHLETSSTGPSGNQKKRILSVLFGRLLIMHKWVMNIFAFVHVVVIVCACAHIFTLGTIDSEKNACYLTWPLTHLFYAFVNYLFAWFFCYNSCEITTKKGHQVLRVSKKFLKVLFLFSLVPIPLKFLVKNFCRNWSLSWNAVIFHAIHIFLESLIMSVYFTWFERKYTGFKLFYKESVM